MTDLYLYNKLTFKFPLQLIIIINYANHLKFSSGKSKKIGLVANLRARLGYIVITLCIGLVCFYIGRVEFLAEKLQGLFTTTLRFFLILKSRAHFVRFWPLSFDHRFWRTRILASFSLTRKMNDQIAKLALKNL